MEKMNYPKSIGRSCTRISIMGNDIILNRRSRKKICVCKGITNQNKIRCYNMTLFTLSDNRELPSHQSAIAVCKYKNIKCRFRCQQYTIVSEKLVYGIWKCDLCNDYCRFSYIHSN